MNITQAVEHILEDMRTYLIDLDDSRYAELLPVLSNSSTGQHTRHVIEFFQCLMAQRPTGLINYDKRLRNELIQEKTAVAMNAIDEIVDELKTCNKNEQLADKLSLSFSYSSKDEAEAKVDTTLERELVYNIEHAIHHMAMIKIGLREIAPEISLPEGFGVAPSTVRYQRETARR